MLGFLKKILKRPDVTRAQPPEPEFAEAVAPGYGNNLHGPAGSRPSPAHGGGNGNGNGNGRQNGNGVEVPLQSILTGLPLELQGRVRQPNVGDLVISMPLDKVLAQLGHGVVKVAYGDLRRNFPQVFTPETDLDRTMVPLPLSEILSRINPALIRRRRTQRQVEVPAEISSPFEDAQNGMAFAASAPQEEPIVAAAPVRPARPVSTPSTAFIRQTSVAAPKPMAPGRSGLVSTPTPPPPAAAPLPPPRMGPPPRTLRDFATPSVSLPKQPAAPIPPLQAPKPPPAPKPPVAPEPVQARIPMAKPPLSPLQTIRRAPAPPVEAEPVAPLAMSPEPAPQQPAVSGPIPTPAGGAPIVVSLVALAESWPDGVRKEIVQSGLVEEGVHLPPDLVERGLKQGRLAFTWRILRSWIKSASAATTSANDATVLDLPLKVVAPLFLARQREASKAHAKIEVDEDIPNLFFGYPQPESAALAAAATARPADTNYYVWDDSADVARLSDSDVKRGPSAGTRFVSKYATPNEIVSRAAALDGVSGALIALPDGLLVASQLSGELNADTLAAFLPQIFGKVSQCTKELRMGELNNLNFTVGNTPWKVFRVNAIFFAAFGRPGEALPTAKLAALAGELDHKPK